MFMAPRKSNKYSAQTSTSSVTVESTTQNGPTRPRPFPLEAARKTPLERQILIQRFEQDALRDRITRLDSRIALNQMARAELARPVSPLVALPDEVIRIVFAFVCNDAKAASHSPISLSHICCRWRAIALGCPAMWSVIRIRGLHAVRLLELYLERSRNSPLQGSIDLVEECSISLAKLTVTLLLPAVIRFHHLHIRCPDNGFARKILKPLEDSKPSPLQTLEIRSTRGAGFGPLNLSQLNPRSLLVDTASIFVTSQDPDTLRALQIDGGTDYDQVSFPDLFRFLSRSGLSLTYLSIGSKVLQPFSKLHTETAEIIGQYSSGIQFPNLTHFRCADPTSIPLIRWLMSATRLEVMVLKNIPLADIQPSFAKLSPALHTLALINCPASSQSYTNMQFGEHIQHLHILHSSPDKSAFDEMLYQLPEHVLWPRLATLTIDLAKFREYPRQFNSLETLSKMRSRTQEASKPILCVFERDADLWKFANGSLWEEVKSVARVRVLPEDRRSYCIPWPPRDDGVFISPSSEIEFHL